jgi:hypothetical protein
MKNQNLMVAKNLKFLWVLVAFILLYGCNSDSGPGPEIHDSKYVFIDSSGQALEGVPGDNDCVLDQFIGLTWEVKSDEAGLRDWRNTYSWYSPDESYEGELDYRGLRNGGQCAGSECDTTAYVQAVNASDYCGHDDWRLPSRDELGSISDPRKVKSPPTVNAIYFPYAQAEEYWSGNDYQFQYDTAWRWSFKFGHDRVDWKTGPARVRLVRGEVALVPRVKE